MKGKSKESGYAPLSALQQTLCVLSNRATRFFKQKNSWVFEDAKHTPTTPNLWVRESSTLISDEITLESWFIRGASFVARSELYKAIDGSVVAFQDNINGVNGPLHMDSRFKSLYEDEPEFEIILKYSGVLDPTKIKLYHLS